MLTRKQYELLMFIAERMHEEGVPPSFEEMKEALDLKSKSGIHRLIMALEERGFIRRLPNRARALEILKLPDMPQPQPSALARRGFTPNVIEGDRSRSVAPAAPAVPVAESGANGGADGGADGGAGAPGETIDVPVMGRIAAGVPIEAIQQRGSTIGVPAGMLGSGEHFALEVRGDSMIEAGILDGDIVVIRRQDRADTGDIVVALVDDEEATLKRLKKKGSSVALEAANPEYETRIFGPDRIRIQGRLVALFREY